MLQADYYNALQDTVPYMDHNKGEDIEVVLLVVAWVDFELDKDKLVHIHLARADGADGADGDAARADGDVARADGDADIRPYFVEVLHNHKAAVVADKVVVVAAVAAAVVAAVADKHEGELHPVRHIDIVLDFVN